MFNQNTLAVMRNTILPSVRDEVCLSLALSFWDASTKKHIQTFPLIRKIVAPCKSDSYLKNSKLVWSPSGKRLAFYCEFGIYIFETEDSRQQPALLTDKHCIGLTWLSDNECFVIVREMECGYYSKVYLTKLDDGAFIEKPHLMDSSKLSLSPNKQILWQIKKIYAGDESHFYTKDAHHVLPQPDDFLALGHGSFTPGITWSPDSRFCAIIDGQMRQMNPGKRQLRVLFSKSRKLQMQIPVNEKEMPYSVFWPRLSPNFFVAKLNHKGERFVASICPLTQIELYHIILHREKVPGNLYANYYGIGDSTPELERFHEDVTANESATYFASYTKKWGRQIAIRNISPPGTKWVFLPFPATEPHSCFIITGAAFYPGEG